MQKPHMQGTFDSEFAQLEVAQVYSKLGTAQSGLSHEEAKKRFEKFGPNEPAQKKDPHIIIQILKKFNNPLILVLLTVAALSLFMGQGISAALVFVMALISVLLSFQQEYKANLEAKKLSEMVSTTSTVIREGKPQEMNIKMLVPGDIVDLSAGVIVPADIRIVSSNDLFVDQATLTGESFPSEKSWEPCKSKSGTLSDQINIAFMGSHIVSGSAIGVVLKTGKNTQFGELAAKISQEEGATSFEFGVRSFVMLMLKSVIILVIVVFLINAVLKGNVVEAILFSLAVAVGLTPEMLSMIITVNLSNAAMDMSKKKVIVKKLDSIQNFGAMDVLCTDKTGTLTIGEVVLEKYFDLSEKESTEVLMDAYVNSFFQTGLNNVLDKAILKHDHPKIGSFEKIDEIPFDFERRIMSVVVSKSGKHLMFSKGAPEEIAKRCGRFVINGRVQKFHGKIARQLMGYSDKYTKDGFRVLAVAFREFPKNKKAYTKADERGLILKGFVIFLDPPKPSAKKVIETLRRDGIRLIVLTGDSDLLTKKVCEEVGIDVSGSGIVTGELVDKMSDAELGEALEKTNVFARLNPFQKERAITILRKNGHTVGYLGDGINDAPSLKAADVGISVSNGADIAKESADIILLQKSLSVLGEGVIEGRRTYANILKYVKMGASSNLGNMISVTGASLFLKFLPMQPVQILLNNFLYDMSQLTIPTDNVDKEYLVKPTPWRIEYIKKFMVFFGPVSSLFDFITFGFCLWLGVNVPLFNTIWFLESLSTQALVIHIIRTPKIPFIESWPSRLLLFSSFAVIGLALLIVMSPVGKWFGFAQPSGGELLIILGIVLTYLVAVQLMKSWFLKKYGYE